MELLVVPDDSGSADALRHIRSKLTRDFVLLAGDVVSDVSLQTIADRHRLHQAAVTCLFKQVPPREQGVAKKAKELDGIDFVGHDDRKERLLYLEAAADCDDGKLGISASLLRAQPHLQVHTDLVDAHIYIFSHWVLEVLEAKPNFASAKFELLPYLVRKQFLSKANLPAAATRPPDPSTPVRPSSSSLLPAAPDDFRCSCYVLPHDSGYCLRANTLASYIQANMDVAKGGVTLYEKVTEENEAVKETNFVLRSFSSDSSRGVGVEVGGRSTIKKSCVGPHCVIGSNVRLTNCILMDHVKIADKVNILNSIICSNAEIGEGASLKDSQVGLVVVGGAHGLLEGWGRLKSIG